MNIIKSEKEMYRYHQNVISYLEISSKNIFKSILFIFLGWLLTIVSSVLWPIIAKMTYFFWIVGAAMILTGLDMLYQQKKG